MPGHGDDATVRSIVEVKRALTELKLDALLRADETSPTADIHDIDAIVAEVAAGVDTRRTTTGRRTHAAAPRGVARHVDPMTTIR
ncbi:hypothetical protein [Saccharothrix deserti]|uniref:hypothetical protein n=1 Tax=Saccharothrix deserti TaxID=2593674 RepID=UPI00131E06DC|nr:hypothetical protein [Saccharothrix deserti]